MDKKRVQFASDPHRGSKHRYLSRDTFKQFPYQRVYGRQSFESGRKRSHGRPFSQGQQTWPHKQHEEPAHKALMNLIIKDLQPLSIVKASHLCSLQPLIGASWIRTELQSLYRNKRMEVQNAVNNANNLVISAELWSSSQKTFYLTVSCHLISREWKLKSYILDTAHLLTKNTAEDAVEHLLRISNEWNITEKTHCVVTNVDGIKKAKNNVCRWTYIPCFAFTLEKVFRETIKLSDLEPLLWKCQQIVAFFHQSDKASQSLQEYRTSYKLQRSELTQSSGLKWLPTLQMLKNILVLWPAIFKVFVDRRVDNLCLNENERKIVQHIVEVLQVLKDVTQKLGRTGFIPISNIIPLVQKLQEGLRDLGMMENTVAKKLSEMCDHHFGRIKQNLWFAVCTVLDPLHKTSVLWDSGIKDITAEINRQMYSSLDTQSEESDFQKYWKITGTSANALEFWKTSEEFGKLAVVARKYLTVVSTAVPLERVHQLQESQIIDRRNHLEPENLNMILFLNSNQ